MRPYRNKKRVLKFCLCAGGNTLLAASLAMTAFAFHTHAADNLPTTAMTGPTSAEPVMAYRIGPGDVLDISVIDDPQLSKIVTVVPDGTIAYPYLGEIKAAGMTTADLRRRIIAALKDQLVDPQVTVSISRRRETSVSVLGAVKAPGKRTLQEGWRALDVLADCGGLTVRPEWASATIVRGDGSEKVHLDLLRLLTQAEAGENPLIKPGDILLVQEREVSQTQVQVVGEVFRPGPAGVPSDGSVITVLNTVGGATPDAALAEVTLLRAGQTIPLNLLNHSDTGQVPGNVRLQPGDTLVVPRNKRQFAVLGAVVRPGLAVYPEDRRLDVVGALAMAGGSNNEADLKGSLILRRGKNAAGNLGVPHPVTVKVDLSEALKRGGPALNVALEPGDVLYIPNRRVRGAGLSQVLSVVPLLGLLVR